jgi:hypothetical protein
MLYQLSYLGAETPPKRRDVASGAL